jgi:hypothetical protein
LRRPVYFGSWQIAGFIERHCGFGQYETVSASHSGCDDAISHSDRMNSLESIEPTRRRAGQIDV